MVRETQYPQTRGLGYKLWAVVVVQLRPFDNPLSARAKNYIYTKISMTKMIAYQNTSQLSLTLEGPDMREDNRPVNADVAVECLNE